MATSLAISTALTPNMGVGMGWPWHESVFLCKSFIRTSKDSFKGNGRKLDDLERLVHSTLDDLMHDDGLYDLERTDESKFELRSQVAVISRFKKIRRLYLVFEGFIRQVKACKPTGGPTDEDIVHAVKALYDKKATIEGIYEYFKKPQVQLTSPGRSFAHTVELEYTTTDVWRLFTESQQNTSPTAARAAGGAASPGAGEIGTGNLFVAPEELSASPTDAGGASGKFPSKDDNVEDERPQK